MITSSSRVKELTEFIKQKKTIPGGVIGATRGLSDHPVIGLVPRKTSVEVVLAWLPFKISCYEIDIPGKGQGSVPLLGDESWLVSFACLDSKGTVSRETFTGLNIELKLGQPIPKYTTREKFEVRQDKSGIKISSTVVIPTRLDADEDEDVTLSQEINLGHIVFPDKPENTDKK